MKLIKSLIESGTGKGKKTNNILGGLGVKGKESSSRIDDNSNFSGGVDFLMDENILTNESREEEDSHNVRTPSGIAKNMGANSINVINSAAFSNQQAMKKMKSSNKVINNSKANNVSK